MKIIYYEIKMDLLRTIRYKMGIITDIIVFTVLLCLFFLSNTGASFQDRFQIRNYKTLLLLGYIAWSLSVSAISTVSSQISAELQWGTLFFKLNCKLPLQILYIGDLISASIIQIIIIVIYSFVTYFVFNVEHFINLPIIMALIVNTFGMYGIGLIVAGLSIYFKRIGSIVFLIQVFLLFITDTVPTASIITKISGVLPLTICNAVIRGSFIQQNIWGVFLFLCISSGLWFLIGYIFFEVCLKLSKKKGNLLLY